MSIYYGGKYHGAVYFGGKYHNLAYLGSTKVWGKGTPVLVDPNTLYLFHFTGNNTDVKGHTVTNNGSPNFSVEGKFGTGAYFASTYLRVAAPTEFGSGDFTIDFWLKCGTQSPSFPAVLGTSATSWGANAAGILLDRLRDNKLSFYCGAASLGPIVVSTTNITDNVWRHFAMTKAGNVYKLFVNGVLESTGTDTNNATIPFSLNNNFCIGYNAWDSHYGNFYLDELRISNCVRWTENFTVPVAPYEN